MYWKNKNQWKCLQIKTNRHFLRNKNRWQFWKSKTNRNFGKVETNGHNVPATVTNKDFLGILEKFPILQWSQLSKVPASEIPISKEDKCL